MPARDSSARLRGLASIAPCSNGWRPLGLGRTSVKEILLLGRQAVLLSRPQPGLNLFSAFSPHESSVAGNCTYNFTAGYDGQYRLTGVLATASDDTRCGTFNQTWTAWDSSGRHAQGTNTGVGTASACTGQNVVRSFDDANRTITEFYVSRTHCEPSRVVPWPGSRRSLTGATHWTISPAGATGQPQSSSTSGTRRSSPDARYTRRIFGRH